MIFKKIISDKKGILDTKLIIMILVILVVVVTIVFLFKSNTFGFLENFLPDFGTEESIGTSVSGEVGGTQLAELMKTFSKITITNYNNKAKSCNCGIDCDDYAKWIVNYSKENSVEPVLVLALMMQESNCNKGASSGSSYGLMQINAGVWCGQHGLPAKENENMEDCKKELFAPEKSIEVGIKILKGYYNYEDKIYQSRIKSVCNNIDYQKQYLSYTDKWDAALRLYNGPGCVPPGADINYVENVNALYKKLKQNIK